MRTCYFDTQDGVPVRDNKGIDFRRASEAIEHSKKLASGIRGASLLLRKTEHGERLFQYSHTRGVLIDRGLARLGLACHRQ